MARYDNKLYFGDNKLKTRIKTIYMNKYYNLFFTLFNVKEGFDKEQEHYFKKKLWSDGTVAAFNIAITGDICLAPYAPATWNTYDFAETESLINERGVPFIPAKTMVVNKDVVNCFIQPNHKSVKEMVEYYIDRMVQVDMIINTNLELQKIPFIVTCAPEDLDKFKDIFKRILNNEICVYTDIQAEEIARALETQAPYVVDKLHAYRIALENELLTYLGIDNNGNMQKATTQTLDEVNANNAIINIEQINFENGLNEFVESVKEVLGHTLVIEWNADKAEETYESRNRSDGEKESGFSRQNDRGGEQDE